jgi:hypothetical protein
VFRLSVGLVATLAFSASCRPASHDSAPPAVVAASAELLKPASPAAAPKKPQRPLTGMKLLERGSITKLTTDRGHLVAELEGKTRVLLVIATKRDPLLPRSRAAHYRIAEKLAPGLVAPTAFRSFKVAELAKPADAPTLALLEKEARVLGNGRIEGVVCLAPAATLERVDIANLQENQPAWRWEGRLVVRDPAPVAERATLSSYQSLLAVDWIVGNGKRRFVQLHETSGRITVADQSEAFSATIDDNAIHDTLARFARHMTYSKSLNQNLHALSRETVEKALRFGKPAMLLVTPKQAEEIAGNARAMQRVIQTRVKHRGEAEALSLP